jgi:2-amino-4-hydroxy-6-hydroxymethyldihydropteridine diphosphokinase
MYNAVFLLGSNLGDRLEILNRAIDLLREEIGELRKISSVYETAAWGKTDQDAFLNQVLELETEFLPDRILHATQEIEKKLGRVRQEKWGPRIIDIDILFHANHIQENPELTIPHPQLHLRRFTLLPLAEILPDLQHPTLHKSIAELLEECPDQLPVHLYPFGL